MVVSIEFTDKVGHPLVVTTLRAVRPTRKLHVFGSTPRPIRALGGSQEEGGRAPMNKDDTACVIDSLLSARHARSGPGTAE